MDSKIVTMAMQKSGSNWSLNYGDSLNSKRDATAGNKFDEIPLDDEPLDSGPGLGSKHGDGNQKTLTES